ncbi:MAG: PAS domain S-box protein [Desulfuromonadales bacterium]|nr:PAS domain S-box protein [Desulfuromonadales bacterium]
METIGQPPRKGIVALSRGILQGVNRILQEALVCNSEEELGNVCLSVAEELTLSKFGFIGLVDQQGQLFDIAISNPGWDACRMEDQTGHRILPTGLRIHGIYCRVLRDGKGFFTNDPATHPDSIGLPQGHPPLTAFLGVPLFYDDKVIGMVGLANRAGGYRNDDLFALNTLSVAMVQALKRKQDEAALRESDDQFRAMFESPSVGMAQADPATGRLLRVNEVFAGMLGYLPAELIDKPFSELTHPEDRQADWEKFSRFVRGEVQTYQTEKRYIHKAGHAFWVMVTVNLVRNAAGKPVRTVAVIHDISERKRMEEELRAAHQATQREQQFLEAVFQALPVGICITDEQGGIVRTNQIDEEIWGGRPVTGGVDDYHEYKAWWANTGKPVQPEEWASARAVRKGETVFGQVLRIQRFDGKERIVNNSAAPVRDDNGRIIGSVVSIQDITSLWELAAELRIAKSAAEEASRAKSEFLASMSHEIRTPMTVFMSAIEQLQHVDRNPEHQQLLDLAEQASQRLYVLVNEILDFSKIEARRLEIDADWFNVRNCLQESLTMMAVKAREKNLRLELEVAPSVPQDIVGDPYRLGQILLNLIGNAIKFTNAGEVRVAVQRHDSALEFAVSDTGIGIPEDKQETIFQTFSQVDSSSTRRHGGTGLGLAITKGLVELMGGRIGVRSRPGQGSTFTFTLPMKSTQSPGQAMAQASGGPVATDAPEAHLLLVEDNPMIREVVLMILSRRPWQTTTAGTGRDAVQKWQTGNFDLIIMDLQMPDMDGLDATREIRRQEAGKGKRVGIVGLTAHANRAVRKECLEAGMNDVLVKPFETASLYAAIERCLAG